MSQLIQLITERSTVLTLVAAAAVLVSGDYIYIHGPPDES